MTNKSVHLLGAGPLAVGAESGDQRGAGDDVGLDAPAAPHLVEQRSAAAPVAAGGTRADDGGKGVACVRNAMSQIIQRSARIAASGGSD